MLRESAVAFFTLALVGVAKFGLEYAQAWRTYGWSVAVSGFWGSILGLGLSAAVIFLVGWWLVRDDKAKRKEEKERHAELIGAINAGTKAVKDIGDKFGGDIGDI
jgi:uncharacterized membrane protein YdjX (TVP38/TMEM64 family)